MEVSTVDQRWRMWQTAVESEVRAGRITDGSGVSVEKDLDHVPAWDSGEGSPFMNLWMVDLCLLGSRYGDTGA